MTTTESAERPRSQARRSLRRTIERTFDAGLAAFAISLALPLFALIALLIVIDDPGPVFARTRQIGVDGRHFDLVRFRTQLVSSGGFQEPSARRGDQQGRPRCFKLGALLRHTGLEDIPTLINLARGELPIVGRYTWRQVFRWLDSTDR
jgi:lipopolysaccharide/colanic/teichoic acid biosynthesis glycosyltransferase